MPSRVRLLNRKTQISAAAFLVSTLAALEAVSKLPKEGPLYYSDLRLNRTIFSRYLQVVSDAVWPISPVAGILVYVHTASEQFVLESALGRPEYQAWLRARSGRGKPG